MAGIIKDPTQEMVHQVLDVVKDVQPQLDNIDHTLNQIASDLISIQVAQQEIARRQNATTMSNTWTDFKTNYTEKLDNYVGEYQSKINKALKSGGMRLLTMAFTSL